MQDLIPKIERRSSLMYRYGSELSRISDRHQADLAIIRGAKLRRADALMRNVVESSFDGIITLRQDGSVETANPAALRTFGYSREALSGEKIQTLLPDLVPGTSTQDEGALLQLGSGPKEMQGRHKEGKRVPLEVAVSETLSKGEPLFVMILRDTSERQLQQEQLRHQALHDALTALPNRVLLSDRLEYCLEFARRTKEPMALLLLDLDRFKEVNDTLGHQIGDDVLVEVARRLAKAIRASDTVARLGGDEFAVLLPAVTDLRNARMVAERIVLGLSAPFKIVGGLSLDVGVSIGIALHPDHADEPGKLLQCADIAMYAAKEQQLGITLYDEDKDTHSVRHLTLTGALKRAIDQDELEFHYQPQIDIRTQEVVSVEALARWDHPEHGAISPDEFIPQAERTGLIESLTRWAFGSALKKLVVWREEKVPLSISINLSARNLHEKDLPDIAERLCAEYGVPTNDLVLELTESALMVDPEGALAVVRRLADMGFRLSIDDFGTGFSSLSYLRYLPVQELKIDQSFVMGMLKNEEDLVIVRSTIDLAHNLGLLVVAEGIESARHINMLRDLGCDIGQGYHISRPMSDDKIKKWIESGDWVIANNPATK